MIIFRRKLLTADHQSGPWELAAWADQIFYLLPPNWVAIQTRDASVNRRGLEWRPEPQIDWKSLVLTKVWGFHLPYSHATNCNSTRSSGSSLQVFKHYLTFIKSCSLSDVGIDRESLPMAAQRRILKCCRHWFWGPQRCAFPVSRQQHTTSVLPAISTGTFTDHLTAAWLALDVQIAFYCPNSSIYNMSLKSLGPSPPSFWDAYNDRTEVWGSSSMEQVGRNTAQESLPLKWHYFTFSVLFLPAKADNVLA